MVKVGIVSLGCSKNLVDSERMLYKLHGGFALEADAALSDVAIINTCGFIQSAKEEAIETILEFTALKKEGKVKRIVVTGCLAERYNKELLTEFPEVDAVVGLGSEDKIAEIIASLDDSPKLMMGDKCNLPLSGGRISGTLSFISYLKIAEGCDNCCTYCAIPQIRGKMRSVPMETLVSEAAELAKSGVKELNIIAQDITRYGEDLYGECKLPELLEKIAEISGIQWIRLLYCYPERITDKLIDTINKTDKIVKYLDIPIQHCDGEILQRMNRPGDEQSLRALIAGLRAKIPGIILRTTLITGFPGETDEKFSCLCEFVSDMKFDRLGCFPYSAEEGTPAASFPDQIDDEIKLKRAEIITDTQSVIMGQNNNKYLDSELVVLTEGFDRYAECFFGRSYMDAPDIDGKIFFTTEEHNKPYPGDYVTVRITETLDLDLLGFRND
ncbi:MAG: 30S ribosomal protein S12 methylthiotransferase RimO [Ruminococcus sp.]|jgi:ribosomal protein S12 methylthiotransferase|nr:30S ribosomal protein S12 methylthiotransferase RimO [Ruminococcus sp.]